MRKERNMTVKNSVREVKTALAKLLATENLTVEFAQVQTASFDVKNRVLRLPIFKSEEQDPTVLDLFVGHEVAHELISKSKLLGIYLFFRIDNYGLLFSF